MGSEPFARMAWSLAAAAALVTVSAIALGFGIAAVRLADRPGATALVLAATLVALAALAALARRLAARVPRRTILELDLCEPVRDWSPSTPMGRLGSRGGPTLREIVETLEHAAEDDRVAGLFARVRKPVAGFADAQELRDAVAAFRSRGKFALAHADSFGEFAAGDLAYYVATAFDEVMIQPSGDVGLTGIAWEYRFFRDALDKIGVEPRFDQRHEYKNAMEIFTERGFTPAHREATVRLAESQLDQLVAGIADGRGLGRSDVRRLLDHGPFFGDEALDAALVDRLAYRDEAVGSAKERAGEGARLRYLAHYRKRAVRPARRAVTVALIHGTGAVTRGRSRLHPLTGQALGSDSVAAAFRAAVEDRKVRAILFRVDSPGGSYVASDAIWREVARTRDAGKPVVVTMGNVAASGGYFVAVAADRIVAHPGTLTGSIGVVGGKPVVAGLRRKLGVATDAVEVGTHAGMMSVSRDYRPVEWERLQRWLDRVYDDFTSKVAAGRHLPDAQVAEAARGRVWTGKDAAARGLVDELGGYPTALASLRDAVGLEDDAPLRLVPFPKRRSPLARLRRDRPESSEDPTTMSGWGLPRVVADAAALHAPVAGAARRIGLAPGPLVVPDAPDWP